MSGTSDCCSSASCRCWRPVRASGRWRWACWGGAALAIGLAFGRYVPWYAWTQWFPGYLSLRIPSKHLTLAALALALAAGLGLPRLAGRHLAAGALVVAAALAAIGVLTAGRCRSACSA